MYWENCLNSKVWSFQLKYFIKKLFIIKLKKLLKIILLKMSHKKNSESFHEYRMLSNIKPAYSGTIKSNIK